MRKILYHWIDDIFLLVGCVCVLVGVSMWSVPLTWLIGGLMFIGYGVLFGLEKARNAAQ